MWVEINFFSVFQNGQDEFRLKIEWVCVGDISMNNLLILCELEEFDCQKGQKKLKKCEIQCLENENMLKSQVIL